MSTESDPVSFIRPPIIITLDDITQFPAFEDVVADDIQPIRLEGQREAWEGRVPIRNLLRPPKFNGSIRSIALMAMEDPYDRLLDARERGWAFPHGGKTVRRLDIDEAREYTRGFTFTADAQSSGKGIVGQIQAEMWYMRAPYNEHRYIRLNENKELVVRTSSSFSTGNHGGAIVYRRITKPKLEKDAFIRADAESRKIGWAVLREAMTHPLQGGLADGSS
jgi:hypothetical protein